MDTDGIITGIDVVAGTIVTVTGAVVIAGMTGIITGNEKDTGTTTVTVADIDTDMDTDIEMNRGTINITDADYEKHADKHNVLRVPGTYTIQNCVCPWHPNYSELFVALAPELPELLF